MKHADIIIIGGGQAGLAMSRCLADRGIDHVVLERGRVGERWRNERWDSLRMLTPRWQSRLPGWSYRGNDPHGFMSMPEVIDYLEQYAHTYSAPVIEGVEVLGVERTTMGFNVQTSDGAWTASGVVIATGHCDRPNVPGMARHLGTGIAQVVPSRYRNPAQLDEGGVLVVGASATGVQLASEIARSGRRVTLAVRRHTRLPRRYRGRDIMAWFDALGILTERASEVYDVEISRRRPSLQLTGSDDNRSIDLDTLRADGVRIVGSMTGVSGGNAYFAGDLGATVARAELKMKEQLDRVDRFIARHGLEAQFPAEDRPRPVYVPATTPVLRLGAEGIGTVLWATGFRRAYPWLHVPTLDARGELMHDGGVTPVPGLYVLGLHFLRRRNSSFLDGVGADAAELAAHIATHIPRRLLAAA